MQLKHIDLAVTQRNRGDKPTKLKDLTETQIFRGRKPLLSEVNEESLAEQVRNLIDAKAWFSWTLISDFADN